MIENKWAMEWSALINEKLQKRITNEVIDQLSNEEMFSRWGFCWCDLSDYDLSQLDSERLSKITFNSSTIWPKNEKMPKNFSPDQIIKDGLDPMLGVKNLHKKGITGKGVTMAVIDAMPSNPGHVEINNSDIKYIDVIGLKDKHFHGDAVLTNLCGRQIGVAPEVCVYYYSIDIGGLDKNKEMIAALSDILKKLQSGEKIRVVNVSGPLFMENKAYDGLEVDKEKLLNIKNEIECFDCKVLSSNDFAEYGFHCGHYNFDDDKSNIDNIKMASWISETDFEWYKERVIFVCGGKCVPEWGSNTGYKFEQEDCFSWTIPQCAGLYCLCLQKNSKLTFDEFASVCKSTCNLNKKGFRIINPEGVIKNIMKN